MTAGNVTVKHFCSWCLWNLKESSLPVLHFENLCRVLQAEIEEEESCTLGKMKLLSGIHSNALAYSMTTLGAGMMNSIFNFYYVKLFLNRYQISETAFHVAQVVFMIWNAINDPLFGYIQDTSRLECCARRQVSILYGAPLYGLAFLLPWFPWRHYEEGDWLCGLHLIVALCAFDGLLTFVLLAQCALFAESSSGHHGRLRLIKYNQVATLMASTSVLFCGLVSDNMEKFAYFQAFAVLIAALATACMCCTDNLIPKDILSSSVRSIMYGAGFICPQCLVLLSHASLKKFGYYRIIMFSFYYEGVAAAVMCLLGQEHYYLLAFYVTTNMVIVQASFSLFNLPLADIIDADLIKHKRRLPLSSMVFGTNALFTKPAQSLAPMIVVKILNHYGYYNLNNVPGHPDISSLFLDLHDAMFYLVCLVPLCIAVLQILIWTPFSIQNSHLAAPQ
ncbi:PREDICTED: transmembrane protein 180 isoform X4 [Sturnus vulgaris]|uniref:transmembrane protein 180 isoform X4 n=1 Tax=Sturnus vulgaris TaxID=9172 RepID=UPI00071A25F6|nr:PREDICTED: transmembrane protein 180 isoform X4 [Sturnus vulgaris]